MVLAPHVKEIHKQLKKSGFSKDQIQSKEIYDIVVNTIISEVGKGKKVSVINFGTFSTYLRNMHNPNDVSQRMTKWIVKFTTATHLKKLLNDTE